MRILYDGQIYAYQVAGGINRYFTNIINRLPQDIYPTLTAQCRRPKLQYPTHLNLTFRRYWGFRPRRISDRVRAQYFRWISSNSIFDIHHPTYYTRLTQDSFSRTRSPLVITVHDMIHELLADTVEPQGYTIHAKKDAVTAADAILCVSENTKSDLLKYFPNTEAKITVIYHASELNRNWAYGNEPVPSVPYFLYIGSRTKTYKNFDTLLIAFSKVASISSDILLSVVGEPFNGDEQRLIAELKLANRIEHYQYASDTHLAKLYRCARAFVYPSLYEGFGIPLLEAMACGTVVVAANSSSIPEIMGDAGILFEPKSVNDLADILITLLSSTNYRDQLIAKGEKRAQNFSWDATAEQTVQVYRSLV